MTQSALSELSLERSDESIIHAELVRPDRCRPVTELHHRGWFATPMPEHLVSILRGAGTVEDVRSALPRRSREAIQQIDDLLDIAILYEHIKLGNEVSPGSK